MNRYQGANDPGFVKAKAIKKFMTFKGGGSDVKDGDLKKLILPMF